jgi:hypothetical protein
MLAQHDFLSAQEEDLLLDAFQWDEPGRAFHGWKDVNFVRGITVLFWLGQGKGKASRAGS